MTLGTDDATAEPYKPTDLQPGQVLTGVTTAPASPALTATGIAGRGASELHSAPAPDRLGVFT